MQLTVNLKLTYREMLQIVAATLVLAVCIRAAFCPICQAKEGLNHESKKLKSTFGKSKRIRKGSLVPPPPPVVPLTSQIALPGYVPVGLMAGDELEKKKTEITDRLEHLVLILNEITEDCKEKQDKAKLFESLLTEGVISRRELKLAKREARRIAGELTESQREVDDAKQYLDAINKRLVDIAGKQIETERIKTLDK